MTTRTAMAAAALVALAACGKSGQQSQSNGSGGNGSATATAPAQGGGSAPPAAAARSRLNPGQWEVTVEMAMNGMPADVARMMKGTKVTSRSCITPEEANRPNGNIFAGQKANGCTYQDFAVTGGRIHGTMSCAGESGRGGHMTMTMDGSYGGDSFDVRTKMDATGGQGTAMSVDSRTVGRRIGDCPAGMKEG
jgi:hypothetical protein